MLILTLLVSQVPTFAAGGSPKRSAVEDRYKWNLEAIYPTREAWESDYGRVQNEYISKLKKYAGELNSPEKVREFLLLRDEMFRLLGKLQAYAHMKSDENQAGGGASEMVSRAGALGAAAAEAIAFMEPELLAQPEATIRDWQQRPEFKDYSYSFDVLLKQKARVLSKEEEALLAAMSDFAGAPRTIYNKVTTADMTFPTIKDPDGRELQLSEARLNELLRHPDRAFRKRVNEGVFGAYAGQANTLAATLNAQVKRDVFFGRVRKYDSSLDAALDAEHIPREVYDSLIAAVNNNLQYLHKYVALRKKVLGLDVVHGYDLYVPLASDLEISLSYEEARKMVLTGLAPLGQEYLNTLAGGYDNRWVDVYPGDNKASGAYAFGAYDTHPYILLNYDNTIEGMLALAHESGHAMHFHYSWVNQPFVNAFPPLFTAEVASAVNELLMMDHLIKNAKTDREKLYYMNTLIDRLHGWVFRQAMFAEFEQLIHARVEAGGALSPDSLQEIWVSLIRKYYGADFVVDDLTGNGWARIPHFYRSFYVYKYATALSAANGLAEEILAGEAGAVNRYLDFLQAGNSDYPVTVLKKAGVDVTSADLTKEVLVKFGQLVEEMEAMLAEK